jgi:glutamate-ammonia-ligase adenylyltransferase
MSQPQPDFLARIFDSARAQRTFESLAAAGFVPDGPQRTLLAAAFSNSPFLCRLALREQAALADFFAQGPDAALAAAKTLALTAGQAADQVAAMRRLRTAKRRAALAIALADIGGRWPLERVTDALTRFADACVQGALRFLLCEAAKDSALAGQDGAALEQQTGLTVLAMGKYGAFELNYSSDIDLIVFYDAAVFPFTRHGHMRTAAVEIARGLLKLLSDVTAEDYVFRVDLRLRPDAGATQIAISTEAAEAYYEAMGQNWERAAMIKARACAGDPRTGAAFLKAIEPFVWRRSLDFAAIEDIHSIKRQIHANGRHGAIAVAGHNIKLGRGGIREIEFFVQTQQLILGGRNRQLRTRSTIAALKELCALGLVSNETAAELEAAYRFLRTLEHRLQMVEDQQTHTIPKTDEGVAQIACFMGYDDAAAFGAALTRTLETVQDHYARLFEAEPELTGRQGNLVFTGVDDDPETLVTLGAMGFADAAHVAATIRGWHHGRVRAMRSERARELLTKVTPALLAALAGTVAPDAAFAQFDRFLSHLPAGVQFFSLLLAQPHLLELLARIVGSAPRLAGQLARASETLDAMLDPDFLGVLPMRVPLDVMFAAQLSGARDYEAVLDTARRFAREQIFRVGAQIIEGRAGAQQAGPALADIAECVIAGLLPQVEAVLAQSAGRIAGSAFAVIAMGRLGGREMTAASDLDLVFVYEAPQDAVSDGASPLAASTYFARLAQRLIAALTSMTAAGGLYEVDMRLRPTGNKGPVAVSLESFIRYHAEQSWTWERMALTRARVVAGAPALTGKLDAAIRRALTVPGDAAKIMADARAMRARLAGQFPGANYWDLKFTPGGLIDIEFIAQALQLVHAPARPDILNTDTIGALAKLEQAGVLPAAPALIAAAGLQQALIQVLRIAIDGRLDESAATPGLKSLLARSGGAPSFAQLRADLSRAQAQVREIFPAVMGE